MKLFVIFKKTRDDTRFVYFEIRLRGRCGRPLKLIDVWNRPALNLAAALLAASLVVSPGAVRVCLCLGAHQVLAEGPKAHLDSTGRIWRGLSRSPTSINTALRSPESSSKVEIRSGRMRMFTVLGFRLSFSCSFNLRAGSPASLQLNGHVIRRELRSASTSGYIPMPERFY
jgi:hypothetical protein